MNAIVTGREMGRKGKGRPAILGPGDGKAKETCFTQTLGRNCLLGIVRAEWSNDLQWGRENPEHRKVIDLMGCVQSATR